MASRAEAEPPPEPRDRLRTDIEELDASFGDRPGAPLGSSPPIRVAREIAWERSRLPAPLPAPDERRSSVTVDRSTGGVALWGFFGASRGSARDGSARGGGVDLAWLAWGTPRWGPRWGSSVAVASVGAATSARVGGVIGWGAPWNDVFAGVRTELGIAFGRFQGGAHDGTLERRYVSNLGVHMSQTLVLQVPWSYAVRPVAGITAELLSSQQYVEGTLRVLGGVAWRAW